ncbi:MAG: 30S ribosomal protein S7 [Gemmatimonadetes bacterium]|nr:30S ribosomal protein S7 [Gemmatimonadota bacterium]|tara:strand:+ start:6451 stop:6921 length:471 start_codon:yes stop_codon:yes gene_type:complete
MARKRRGGKRPPFPDPKHHSVLVTQFVNCLFKKGKKSTGERIIYDAFDIIKERSGSEGLEVFEKAVDSVKPMIHVRSRRVGGQTYQIPVEVRQDERLALSIRWLILFARQRGEKTMAQKLAGELMDASNGQGRSIQRKEETHRMAEANRAFAHYRW